MSARETDAEKKACAKCRLGRPWILRSRPVKGAGKGGRRVNHAPKRTRAAPGCHNHHKVTMVKGDLWSLSRRRGGASRLGARRGNYAARTMRCAPGGKPWNTVPRYRRWQTTFKAHFSDTTPSFKGRRRRPGGRTQTPCFYSRRRPQGGGDGGVLEEWVGGRNWDRGVSGVVGVVGKRAPRRAWRTGWARGQIRGMDGRVSVEGQGSREKEKDI